jgi:hypothetical protein
MVDVTHKNKRTSSNINSVKTSVSHTKELEIRRQINNYMNDIGDDDFLPKMK